MDFKDQKREIYMHIRDGLLLLGSSWINGLVPKEAQPTSRRENMDSQSDMLNSLFDDALQSLIFALRSRLWTRPDYPELGIRGDYQRRRASLI